MIPLRIQKMSDIRRHLDQRATPVCLPKRLESAGDGLDSDVPSGRRAVMSTGDRRNAMVRTQYLADLKLAPVSEG